MRRPPYTTSDEKMSVVDSTASATRAYAWPTIPAISLMIARSRLTNTPTCAARSARLLFDLTRSNLRRRLTHGWPPRRPRGELAPGRMIPRAGHTLPARELVNKSLTPFIQDLVESRDHDQCEQRGGYDPTDDGTPQWCPEVAALTTSYCHRNHSGNKCNRGH